MAINFALKFDEKIRSGELFNKAQIERKFKAFHKKYGDRDIFIELENNLGTAGELYEYSHLVLNWSKESYELSLICSIRPVDIKELFLPEILRLEDLAVRGRFKEVYIQTPKGFGQYNAGFGNRNIEIENLFIEASSCINMEQMIYKTEVINLHLFSETGSVYLDNVLRRRVECIILDPSINWIQVKEITLTEHGDWAKDWGIDISQPLGIRTNSNKITIHDESFKYIDKWTDMIQPKDKHDICVDILRAFVKDSKKLKKIITFGEEIST